MNLVIRLAIVGSLGLNLGLGYLYLKEPGEGTPAESPLQTQVVATQPRERAPLAELGDLTAYRAKLVGLNYAEEEQRLLVLAQLKRIHFPPPKADARYWELPKAAESSRAAAQLRDSLVALFGEAAWEEPIFAEFFRPLQPQLPFLSARKQVALEQLFISARESAQKQGTLDLDWVEQRKLADQAALELDRSVQQALDPEEFAEYELRMSRLAQALRVMQLNLSEPQYRNLFAAIRQNTLLEAAVTRTLSEPKPSSALYDQKVAGLLGQQYVRFMSQCDPLFSIMNSMTRSQGIAPQAVKSAYAELITAQATIVKLEASKDPGLAAAVQARHQRLTAALGAPVTMMVEGLLGGAQQGPGLMRPSLFGAR